MTDQERHTDRFDAEFSEWAREVPRTPAPVAARRVTARLEEPDGRAPRFRTWAPRLAAACALAMVVASGVLMWRPGAPTFPASPTVEAPPVLPENVIVFWLDPDTPVYFVVGPLADTTGGTP